MLFRALATVSFVALLAVPSFAAGDPPKGGKPSSSEPAKGGDKAMWAVIEVGKTKKVVKVDEIAEIKKKTEASDKEAMAKFEEAKKAAEKAKKPFKEEAPKPTVVKALKEDFKSEADANAYLAKMEKTDKPEHGKDAPKKGGGK